jgi:hypothetical protein
MMTDYFLDRSNPERRSHFRIVYRPDQRPQLKVKDRIFDISDISEGGVRAMSGKDLPFDGEWIRLTAIFLEGEEVDLEGRLVWSRGTEFGLRLRRFIPSSILKKEIRKKK